MMMRMSMAVLTGFIGVSALAGTTYKIPSPNDVGNAAAVAALTNAITAINASNSDGSRILLAPGVYDLGGTETLISGTGKGVHLYINTYMRNGLIAGTGDTPGDTILLGGGERKLVSFAVRRLDRPADRSRVRRSFRTGGGSGEREELDDKHEGKQDDTDFR